MFKRFTAAVLTVFCVSFAVAAQTADQKDKKRVRVIVTDNIAATPKPTATPGRKVVVVSSAPKSGENLTTPKPIPVSQPTAIPLSRLKSKSLRYVDLKGKIEEAKRQMRVKPLRISMSDPVQTTEIIRLAFFDWNKNAVDYAVIAKKAFLDDDNLAFTRSDGGKWLRIRTIRGNGVNTPVVIMDQEGGSHLPLIVQYPIEKYGKFVEMAYYVSTHPGVVTPETVNAGRLYVRNILDTARAKLRAKGIFIQPKVTDIAERLALVEHVDHYRFRNEHHPNIYNDVYMLYALNQGQTYRYSVSRAGAGGMVQMIPSTYRMVRSRFFSVGLNPDFVTGMRDHVNAAQAMLLYMQMTWNDLVGNKTVYGAMERGIATQEQLMAAGYNSNPARLAKYIRRGGANWTGLIPRETKVYLKIYSSVERHVPLVPRRN
ncbi:MAG: hypothetical protein HKN33_03930 [Pyrinomonadaceae bacterium]|nr:hypothetical protein [Pyrinomonadaceae bacterium]